MQVFPRAQVRRESSTSHFCAGLNVGGQNIVKMAGLRLAFEELGFADVGTYIQSGTCGFRAPREKRDQLSARIESGLTSGLRHALHGAVKRSTWVPSTPVDRAEIGDFRGVSGTSAQ